MTNVIQTIFLAESPRREFELMATGKVKPVIDKVYSRSEAAEALRYLQKGHARGKVVINLECSNKV